MTPASSCAQGAGDRARRKALGLVALAGALLLMPAAAAAAELWMFRRAGCPWCETWDREIGAVYGRTEFARRAPLRMVALAGERPPADLKRPVIYSPTFVLVDQGREIGRIKGYAGQEFF